MQITDTTHPTCIPANDTIKSVSGSTVTLTTAAGCSHNGEALVISNVGAPVSAVANLNTSQQPWPSPLTEFCNNGASACAVNAGGTATTTGTDYLFFSIYHSSKGGCSASTGNGCILSYNISNPASVTISGTGLPLNAEVNPGCWATSGIVVDNSSALAGASQIYFVNLNANGAGGPTGGTYTSAACGGNGGTNTIQAVQASQSSP
jgi:hypothetical protein